MWSRWSRPHEKLGPSFRGWPSESRSGPAPPLGKAAGDESYLARTQEDELRCPGLKVTRLVEVTDITATMKVTLASLPVGASARERRAAEEKGPTRDRDCLPAPPRGQLQDRGALWRQPIPALPKPALRGRAAGLRGRAADGRLRQSARPHDFPRPRFQDRILGVLNHVDELTPEFIQGRAAAQRQLLEALERRSDPGLPAIRQALAAATRAHAAYVGGRQRILGLTALNLSGLGNLAFDALTLVEQPDSPSARKALLVPEILDEKVETARLQLMLRRPTKIRTTHIPATATFSRDTVAISKATSSR